MVVYHNTDAQRTEFDINKARKNVEIQAHFFAPAVDPYGEYGPVRNDVFISIQNPADYATAYEGFDGSRNEEGARQREKLQAAGYDGGIMVEDGEVYEYFVFDSKNIKSATDNTGTFSNATGNILYQEQQSTKRGFFRFSPEMTERQIGLLKDADLSTFIHELSHSWLEELKADAARADAPDQLKADWEIIKGWLKSDGSLTVEQHEQFARGGEAYVMEGNAPSPELQSVFARFKRWLVNIYRTLKNLDVKLNDDVRGVFDRLLASDREITLARQAQKMTELFTSAEEAGMTAAEFAAYRKAGEAAHNAEVAILERKLMDELKREQQAWWKDARAEMRGMVEAEAHADPVYRAIRLLSTGKMFDGSEGPAMKLDRAALVRMFGEPFLKKLPRGFGYMYAKEGGVHPDQAAELFDGSSPHVRGTGHIPISGALV